MRDFLLPGLLVAMFASCFTWQLPNLISRLIYQPAASPALIDKLLMNMPSIFVACIFKPLALYTNTTAQDLCSYSTFLFCSSLKTTTQDASLLAVLHSPSKQRSPHSRAHLKALNVVCSASARAEGLPEHLAHLVYGRGLLWSVMQNHRMV